MALDKDIRLAIVIKQEDRSFTIKCENNKIITIKTENDFQYESLSDLYQTGSLFYFDPLKKEVVFSNEAIVAKEDYSIPKERTDLIE